MSIGQAQARRNRGLIDRHVAQAYEEQIMADDTSNLVLEHLRALRAGVDELRTDVRDMKGRLTSLAMSVASLHGDFAGQSG